MLKFTFILVTTALITLLVFSDALVAQTSCTPFPSGLVSWWKGENNANDSQDGNNGTPQNGTTFSAGKVGQAFSLDGVDDYVIATPYTGGPVYAFEFWFNSNSVINSSTSVRYPIQFHTGGSGVYEVMGLGAGFLDSESEVITLAHDGNAGYGRTFVEGISLSANTWYHLAASWNGSSYTMYVNGVSQTTTKRTAPNHAQLFTDATMLRVGNAVFNGVPSNSVGGLIDEVSTYNRALTATEIQAIYTAGSAGKCSPISITQMSLPNGTVGTSYSAFITASGGVPSYSWSLSNGNLPPGLSLNSFTGEISGTPTANGIYPFTIKVIDDNQASALRLLSINVGGVCLTTPSGLITWWKGENNANDSQDGNNGTLQNGTTFATGKVGQAFSFDGVDDYAIATSYTGGPVYAFEFWFNSNTRIDAGSLPRFPIQFHTGSVGVYEVMSIGADNLDSQSEVIALQNDGFGNYGRTFVESITLNPNIWYHFAASWNGSSYNIYINGVSQSTTKGTAPNHAQLFTDATMLRVGNGVFNGVPARGFDGLIDEVSTYNRALTATEIQAIYAAGSAGKCTTTPPSSAVCTPLLTNALSWWKFENNYNDIAGIRPGT
ncbi:MAG: putative Ig domain-containing protein, partial [Ignavibacteriae bacterium]|nr:putative Ig domain-containing protein [Ignavibacteriota bacterium]